MDDDSTPSPIAAEEAVLRGEHWRLTVLTDGLLRLEWADDGVFEDRASTFAVRRRLPVPEFEVDDTGRVLELSTRRLRLEYDRSRPSATGLLIRLLRDGRETGDVWRFGETRGVLGGTTRTLDTVDGRTPLESGVVARHGCAVVDDSRSAVFDPGGEAGLPLAGRDGSRLDLYLFAHSGDPEGAVRDLYAVSGRQPLLPRWALGTWWSRYHAYSEQEYLDVVDRFAADGIPLSVAVIDMDWHRVDDVPEHAGTGWTGYSWNRELFPEPQRFLDSLHERGLATTLNLHPADGIRAFEDAHRALARRLGRADGDDRTVHFDVTDPEFLRAYLDEVLHPLEEQGVDFWWIDWQQGPYSRDAGVDPLWVQNHLHHLDSGRGGRRPLTFSRYAGPGSHRYPIGFSGDTVISWASLRFQPEFTATAANIGYGWWSHDIGGHGIAGSSDPELFLRWVQLGVVSPVLRLHSASSPFLSREPGDLAEPYRSGVLDALRMRHRLVPYLHSMNHRAAEHGIPIARPMHHLHPDRREAHEVPNQFAFGTELLAAPITSPRDPVTRQGAETVWLPPGTWTDIATSAVYAGDRVLTMHRDLASVPTLLRAGGILPLAGASEASVAPPAAELPEELELLVATGADGRFELIEDDGSGETPAGSRRAITGISWDQDAGVLEIGAPTGEVGVLPARRAWTVTLLAPVRVDSVEVEGSGVSGVSGVEGVDELAEGGATAEIVRDESTGRVRIRVGSSDVLSRIVVRVAGDLAPTTAGVAARFFAVLQAADIDVDLKTRIWARVRVILESPGPRTALLAEVEPQVPPALASALGEVLGLVGA